MIRREVCVLVCTVYCTSVVTACSSRRLFTIAFGFASDDPPSRLGKRHVSEKDDPPVTGASLLVWLELARIVRKALVWRCQARALWRKQNAISRISRAARNAITCHLRSTNVRLVASCCTRFYAFNGLCVLFHETYMLTTHLESVSRCLHP